MNNPLDKIKNKIYLLIGRCILTAINNSTKTQKVQVKGLKGEVITDIDRVQPYGLETYPTIDKDAEVVVLFPNGNRDNGIAITVGNREKRPKDLISGQTALWGETGVILYSGDATNWKPNVLAIDPVTGIPHGGPGAGILKLTGR